MSRAGENVIDRRRPKIAFLERERHTHFHSLATDFLLLLALIKLTCHNLISAIIKARREEINLFG